MKIQNNLTFENIKIKLKILNIFMFLTVLLQNMIKVNLK